MTKRVFIYIRVSTSEQAEEGYSLSEQQERLIKYAEAMGWTIVRVFIDPGYSGATLERPGLDELIASIKETDIVLVDKLDRLSRSLFDTLYLIQKVFEPAGVAFVSKNEAFDTSTTFGMAMVGILAIFAELERKRIKERMMDGRNGRAKEGKWHGAEPIGYDYDKTTGLLNVNSYEAMQVQEAFELAANRVPLAEIARELSGKGYRTKYGPWQTQTLRSVLINRALIGEVKHKDEYYEGLHTPIIDLDLFNAVQVIMAERSVENDKYRPGKRYASPLGGIIWCAHCGAKYHQRSAGPNKDGAWRRYYMCYSRSKADKKLIKDPNCVNKNYRDRDLEKIVYDEIKKLKSDTSYIDRLRQSVDTGPKEETLKARIAQLSAQISRFMDLYGIGKLSIDDIGAKIEPLSEEKKRLEAELKTLQAVVPTISNDRIRALADIFEDVLATGDCYAIRDAVVELVNHIEIDGEKVYIHWNF